MVGVLMSLIAALPMFFGIASGRLVDRIGVRRPLLIGTSFLALAVALPGLFPGLAVMPIAAALSGSSFALVHISAQHMVGEMSTSERRRDNFGWLALGFATSNFVGPTVSGFAIDALGHRGSYAVLTVFALASFALLASRRAGLTHTPHGERRSGKRSAFELLRSPDLRRVFVVSGMLAAAWDLYAFVMPIYGTSIGLSASTIGLILASFASATFVVRLALPWISRHLREWPMITATFCVVLNASSTVLPLLFGAVGAAAGMVPVFWTMAAALAAGGWFADRRRRALP